MRGKGPARKKKERQKRANGCKKKTKNNDRPVVDVLGKDKSAYGGGGKKKGPTFRGKIERRPAQKSHASGGKKKKLKKKRRDRRTDLRIKKGRVGKTAIEKIRGSRRGQAVKSCTKA